MKLRILSENELANHPWLADRIVVAANSSSNHMIGAGTRSQPTKTLYSFLTEDEAILASLRIRVKKNTAHLSTVSMLPAVRRDATTHSWLQYIEQWAKQQLLKHITIHIREDDYTFLAYCKSVGYVCASVHTSMPLYDNQALQIFTMRKTVRY